jgi:hypothetical protein
MLPRASERPAAVAGRFYRADPAVLRAEVEALVADNPCPGPAPKALVVPHAGYMYSGPIAGRAYARLAPHAGRITRVVLLGPSHFVGFQGLAAPTALAFTTPLGRVPIDQSALATVADLPFVFGDDRPHAHEHSLEVQLPFLQVVLGAFALAPFAIGDANPSEVAAVLERLWGGDETLIVISTDLSHHHPYAEAQALDAATAARIAAFTSDLDGAEACGCRGLNGMLQLARERRLACERLDLRNSGDVAGDKDRVVGYGAWALREAQE